MEAVLLRSRASWIAEGERITKYFCELEKRNYVSKQMIKLTANNGEEIHEVKDIITEVKTLFVTFCFNLVSESRQSTLFSTFRCC